MAKPPPPFLYRRIADALQNYEERLAIRKEMRRRQAFEAICNAIRIRNADRRQVFQELEQMGLLQRRGQRRVQLRR